MMVMNVMLGNEVGWVVRLHPRPLNHNRHKGVIMTEFGRLHEDGRYEHIRTLPQAAMQKCPHFIMVAEHYRKDYTCRCNDPAHVEMKEWGYKWDSKTKRWIGDD